MSRAAFLAPRRRAMRRALYALILLASVAAMAMPAHAWGPMGHRLVARLAQEQLSPEVRAEAERLLAEEVDPTLPGVANWADNLRTSDPVLGRRSARWHYVNIGESDCHYEPARDCPKGDCVIAALQTQSAILADRSRSADERREALKFVIHMVGDAHQPLHAGYGHDLGGNRHQVRFGASGTNLHSFWDSGLLNSQGLSEAAWLERLRTVQVEPQIQPALEHPVPAQAWAEQSCKRVTEPGFYPPGNRVDTRYIQAQLPQMETQLKLAGLRLAELLETLLGSGSRSSAPPPRH